MGTILFLVAVAVIVAGVVVTKALERKRTARIAAWTFEPMDDDDEGEIIELDEHDVWAAPLPPPPPAQAFHHHVHAH